jgi:hypothetical protein
MTRSDTEHMLLHELAHIKRGDLWVHGFYMLLQVVYWYNPLLWLVRSQMYHLRELCCDATVAKLLKERISEYRQTLIDVARRFLTKPTEPGLGLLGLFEDSNRLLVRLNWLKKETWRYQKMKKLTIITTIVLMLAFVLPMAQAQDKPATDQSNTESVQTVEQPSQSQNTPAVESEQQQKLQELEVRLQQLNAQKQKLEQEIQAMVQARQAEIQAKQAEVRVRQAEVQAGQAEVQAAQAKVKAKEAKEKAEKVKDKAAKAKASADAHKADAHAKHMEQWAREMEAWAEQYKAQMNSPEVQEKYKQLADNWAQKWVNSDEFKQWQKDLQQWAQNLAKFQTSVLSSSGAPAPESGPMPVMPAMPPMPAEIVTPNVAIPAPPALPTIVAPVPPQPTKVIVPKVESRPAESVGPAPVLPEVKVEHDTHDKHIVVHNEDDGKFVATKEMHFVSKVQPGSPFVIRNSLGNIILKPSKDGSCDVRAVIRGKSDTATKAQEMVEQVSMNLHSSDERYYLKPVKPDDDQWSNLNVDLHIAVPPGISPDVQTNMGKIEIYNFQGNIKAITNMGAIKAVNTTGNVELFTKMGAIEFIAPKNMSANLKAYTKMGEIQSELPLEIDRSDMFKRNAQGTIGSGQDNIKITTNMGKISLKWQPSLQDETKL